MGTTIQISSELLQKLKGMKISDKESYENLIWDLVEDRLEFSKETKKNIEQSLMDIRQKSTISLEDMKKKIGI